MCSPRPKNLHAASETDPEYKYSRELDLLNTWADRAHEPAFFSTNHRFNTFETFQDHCFRLSAVARDVMCLSCSPTQVTDVALSSITAFGTQLWPRNGT